MRIFCVLLLGMAVTAVAEEPVYSADFEDGSLDQFEFTDPAAWKIATEEGGNKALSLFGKSDYEPEVRSPRNIAWIKGLDLGSFTLEVNMKQTGREYGHRDMCLFFNKQDASHFYYVHFATKADDHANSIFLVNGEPRVSIAQERTDGTDWGSNEYHRIKIVRDAEAGTIEAYFDDMDEPAMRTVDDHFTSGTIGFGSFDDVGHIDDIRIWEGVKEEE